MDFQLDIPGDNSLTRRRKAAMIVQMLIGDGGSLSLAELRLVDKQTVSSVADEFATELEAIGMTAPGTRDGAIMTIADPLSPTLAERLRAQTDQVRNGDHWPRIVDLEIERLVNILNNESNEICAVVLSKLPVAKAAEVLQKTPGDRARRITFAMSQTADISPDAVKRIGTALAADYGKSDFLAFEKAPVQRLGAILNSTVTDTREDVLEGLGTADPVFASDVRKAIFTFENIATRVKPNDIPNCIRSVDGEVLTAAIAYALAGDEPLVASAEFILENLSQRMAGQIREDADERGKVKKSEAEAAMSEITTAIRELSDNGAITLIDPDDDDEEEDA